MNNDGEGLTHGDVERIVQLVDDAGFGYLHLEVEGLELTLVKGDGAEAFDDLSAQARPAAAPQPASEGAVPAAAPPAAEPTPPTEALAGDPPVAEPAVQDADDPSLIRSPMVGIFYRAPDPESPPYVEPGQSIEAGDTIGLVEVMKMYTAIRAETAGTVVEVLAENAQQVDRGQPLVRIEGR